MSETSDDIRREAALAATEGNYMGFHIVCALCEIVEQLESTNDKLTRLLQRRPPWAPSAKTDQELDRAFEEGQKARDG
jgi:hypothetical protein